MQTYCVNLNFEQTVDERAQLVEESICRRLDKLKRQKLSREHTRI
jgi:hypothetical protein